MVDDVGELVGGALQRDTESGHPGVVEVGFQPDQGQRAERRPPRREDGPAQRRDQLLVTAALECEAVRGGAVELVEEGVDVATRRR